MKHLSAYTNKIKNCSTCGFSVDSEINTEILDGTTQADSTLKQVSTIDLPLMFT